MKMGNKIIGDGLFIIAEVGNQFNGDVKTSFDLIDVVVDSGADAIKFIFWFPDEIMCDNPMYTYEKWVSGIDGNGGYVPYKGIKTRVTEPMFDLLERLTLPLSDWRIIKKYCDKRKVTMLATIQSRTGIEWAEELELPAYKLSAWDWNNPLLYEAVAERGKPIIWDIGTVNEGELKQVISKIDNPLLLMHEFHTDNYGQMNMETIPYLIETLGIPVGFASTDFNDELDCMAIALGAIALEKRLTLNRRDGVLHSAISKEPEEFKDYVRKMRLLHNALGEYSVIPSDNDLAERLKWFRHLVADKPIKKGEIITRDMIEAKRGWDGVTPIKTESYIGKEAEKDYERNEAL